LPNLVLITLDTTRADALGSYGGPSGISPSFDAIAERGVQFDWAFSHSPTTLSAHSSMFTGLDPHGHAVPRNGFPLSDVFETLAERLQSHGYDTLGVVAASVLDKDTGMAQGFRLFDDETPVDMVRRFEDRADNVTRRALRLLEKRATDRPFFLWVHYYDAHSPYDAPKDFQARFTEENYRPEMERGTHYRRLADYIRAGRLKDRDLAHLKGLYWAEVAWVDQQMGRLMDSLKDQGLLENSVVAVTADHGEALNNGKLHPLGHGHDVDSWATHVPLVIAGSGKAATAPMHIEQTVKISDLGSTLLAMAGFEETLGQGQNLKVLMDGNALKPALVFMEASKPKREEDPDLWNNIGNEQGLVEGRVLYLTNPRMRPTDRLFSLGDTQKPLQDKETLVRLRAALEAWNQRAPPHRTEDFSEELHLALQALGYIE
jgi:arylsulfatase